MTEERKLTYKNLIENANRAWYTVDDFLFLVAFFQLFFGWGVILFLSQNLHFLQIVLDEIPQVKLTFLHHCLNQTFSLSGIFWGCL